MVEQENPTAARQILRAEFAKAENIEVFGWFCFRDYTGKNSPYFHKEMWEEYQIPGMVGIAAPRGHAKSTSTDVVYAGWIIANGFVPYTLLISDTYTLAVKQLDALGEALRYSPGFVWLYGDIRGGTWSENMMETKNGCMIQAMGKGQQVRGSKYKYHRPKFVILDDIENAEELRSPERRQFVQEWVLNELIPAMDTEGTLAVIGTILSDDSLLQNVINGHGSFASWRHLFYQALNYHEDGSMYALWPEMWSAGDLYRMGTDPTFSRFIGSIPFAQEYQNQPRSDKDRIFKGKDIGWVDALPETIRFKVLTVDPAISKKDTADYTALIGAALGHDNKIYVYAIDNTRYSFMETIAEIRESYNRWQPNLIGVEVVAYQEALREALAGLPVRKLDPDKDKVRRAIAVSQYFEQGRIVILRSIKNSEILFDQLTQFPTGAHDDLVDALVYAIGMLIQSERPIIRSL